MLNKEKVSTELNLALEIPYEMRTRALDLNEGFYPLYDEWELIIRYFGSLDEISRALGFTYIELFNGYAIIRITQDKIDLLSNYPQIIFIEKPKAVYFEQTDARELAGNTSDIGLPSGYNASCFNLLNNSEPYLKGKGVLVAVIDSGDRKSVV